MPDISLVVFWSSSGFVVGTVLGILLGDLICRYKRGHYS